jgi:myosin heavy subunit
MPRQGSVITIVFIVFISITLALAGSGFFLLQKEKLRAVELEEKLGELNKKQVFTEEELSKSKQLISTLQTRLEESKNQIQTLTADLELQKKDSQESRSKMDRLNIDLVEQQKLRQDLENKFDLAQVELHKATVKIEELDSEKETLESKVKELEAKTQEVELGKIIVSPEGSESGVKHYEVPEVSVKAGREPQVLGLQGKVLVVNKEYNFVVINLGAKDGVDIGDEFSVFDDSAHIGDVKVEKVHDSMAAAGFLSADMKDNISEGNKVIQKVK